MPSKKLFRALLVAILLSGLIIACQGVEPASFTPDSTRSTATEGSSTPARMTPEPTLTPTLIPTRAILVSPEELRGQMVQFWHPWSGARGIILAQLAEEFNLQNEWGIFVVAKYQGNVDELDELIRAAIANGEAPNVAVGYLHQALSWNESHALVDLEVYLQDAQWGLEAEQQKGIITPFWEQECVGSARLGIPAQRSAQLLLYNQSWAQLLGFKDPPQTPEEFEKQACAAANYYLEDEDPSNDGLGGWIVSTDYATILSWAYSFGAEITFQGEEGGEESIYQFDTPEMEQTFSFLRGLWDSGCAWEAATSYPVAEFAERKGLFAHFSLLDLPYLEEAFRKRDSHDTWRVIPYPSPNLSPALDVYGLSYYIFASPPEQQLASWVWLKWLMQTTNQVRLISVDGSFPLDATTTQALEGYARAHPQWFSAVEMLTQARAEPPYRSWSTVRWALQDAATQLFRAYFSIDQVPNLLAYLELTADELHSGQFTDGLEGTEQSTQTP